VGFGRRKDHPLFRGTHQGGISFQLNLVRQGLETCTHPTCTGERLKVRLGVRLGIAFAAYKSKKIIFIAPMRGRITG